MPLPAVFRFASSAPPRHRVRSGSDCLKLNAYKLKTSLPHPKHLLLYCNDVEDEVELRESQGFKVKDLAKAQQLAEENRNLIIQKWNERLA